MFRSLLGGLAVIGGCFPLVFSAAADTRILLAGDSITNGGRNFVGYRYALYNELIGSGYAVDFVGNNSTLSTADGGSTPNPALYPAYNTTFDRDHDGYWGIKSSEYLSQKSIAAAALAPDIAIIDLGTNDIPAAGQSATNYQASMNNIGATIDNLRAVNPDVKIVLTQLTPPSTASPTFGSYGSKFSIFNENIKALVPAKSNLQSPVVLVNQFQGFDPIAMTDDGIHPNQYGQQLMADRYYIGLQAFLSPGQPVKSPGVHIGNASFDDITLGDGAHTSGATKAAWTFAKGAGTEAGIFNPDGTSYLGTGGSVTPEGATGANVAYLFNNAAITEGKWSSLSQTIGAILVPDMRLNLSVAIGNRLPGDLRNSIYGGYRIELWAGSTLIGFSENEMTPLEGSFQAASFSILSNNLDPSLYGESFTIRLRMTSLASRAATDFDDVHFEMSAVPEPGAIALLFFSGLGVSVSAVCRRAHRRGTQQRLCSIG